MSTRKFYKEQIAKAEAAIRNLKIPPPEIAEILTLYHKSLAEYYKKIQPDIDLLQEQINHCNEGMNKLRNDKSKSKIPAEIYEKYLNWLKSYLSGIEFGAHKPYVRQLLANGTWMLITAPNGYHTKTTHWLARVNRTTCLDGNKYCIHTGRVGKKELKLYSRFIEEILNDTRTLEKSIYLADVFPEQFSEKEQKLSKDKW